MNSRTAALLLLTAAFAGCSKSDDSMQQSANPGAPNPAVSPNVNTPSAMNGTTPTAPGDTAMAPTTAPAMGMSTPTTGPSAMDKMKSMGASASDSMKDMGSNMSDTAQKYLDQVNEYTKDKKYDMADSTMAKLQTLKDKLPAEWQDKITSAQQMLDSAKKS